VFSTEKVNTVTIFVVAFIVALGVLVLGFNVTKAKASVPETDTGFVWREMSRPGFTTMLKPVYLPPKTINIGRLGINQELEEVGVVGGRIGVPSNWQSVAYFNGGSRAGEAGNTIIVGHYDDNQGLPAAFWSIKTLEAGDQIVIGDGHRSFTYQVLDKAYIPADSSSETLMQDLGGPGLVLVTCGGNWNPGRHSYSLRLLVKAKLTS